MNKQIRLTKEFDGYFMVDFGYLKPYINELLYFLDGNEYMQTIDFAKTILFNAEIKFNNNIEGINDGIEVIDEIIDKMYLNLHGLETKRIINLYKGYRYILSGQEINKDTLKQLYGILSDGLLNDSDKAMMGEYYRLGDVNILRGGHLVKPYMGMEENINNPFTGVRYDKIEKLMDVFFEYINSDTPNDEVSVFIKSQIMHFYFVYIHPYFDVNGRTSRTLAMWYLLNNKSYPYIIFNRAIAFSEKTYSDNIVKGKVSGDITLFLRYMLESVLRALEKEYLINNIVNNSSVSLSKDERQILECFLSLKGEITVKDLASVYNSYNNKKKIMELYKNKILTLINKGILLDLGNTKSYIAPGINNIKLAINKENISVDSEKVKHLKLNKYTYWE